MKFNAAFFCLNGASIKMQKYLVVRIERKIIKEILIGFLTSYVVYILPFYLIAPLKELIQPLAIKKIAEACIGFLLMRNKFNL